jgi:hypothetical protein
MCSFGKGRRRGRSRCRRRSARPCRHRAGLDRRAERGGVEAAPTKLARTRSIAVRNLRFMSPVGGRFSTSMIDLSYMCSRWSKGMPCIAATSSPICMKREPARSRKKSALALRAGREQLVGLLVAQAAEDFGQRSRRSPFPCRRNAGLRRWRCRSARGRRAARGTARAEVARQAAENLVDPASDAPAPCRARAGSGSGAHR